MHRVRRYVHSAGVAVLVAGVAILLEVGAGIVDSARRIEQGLLVIPLHYFLAVLLPVGAQYDEGV